MDSSSINEMLCAVADGKMSPEQAEKALSSKGYSDMGYAKVDLDRLKRQGASEVVFCQGKTEDQIAGILRAIDKAEQNLLGTRAWPEAFERAKREIDGLQYNEMARIIWKISTPPKEKKGIVHVISAGTSDMPVAEEAAVTAEFLGNKVKRTFDAGVAGVHRLLDNIESIREARVLIVVAGMEGALASVVGGLVHAPVIAVPTSIGYGANFGGLSALLGMLNSCASNVAVVNIDNSFGAGSLANLINGN